MILPQRIRSTVDEKEQKQLLMDLDVVMRSNNCPFIVQFYGALFTEVSISVSTQRSLQLSLKVQGKPLNTSKVSLAEHSERL